MKPHKPIGNIEETKEYVAGSDRRIEEEFDHYMRIYNRSNNLKDIEHRLYALHNDLTPVEINHLFEKILNKMKPKDGEIEGEYASKIIQQSYDNTEHRNYIINTQDFALHNLCAHIVGDKEDPLSITIIGDSGSKLFYCAENFNDMIIEGNSTLNAFNNIKNIKHIDFSGNMENRAFNFASQLGKVKIKGDIGKWTFSDAADIDCIEISGNIHDYGFAHAKNIKNLIVNGYADGMFLMNAQYITAHVKEADGTCFMGGAYNIDMTIEKISGEIHLESRPFHCTIKTPDEHTYNMLVKECDVSNNKIILLK